MPKTKTTKKKSTVKKTVTKKTAKKKAGRKPAKRKPAKKVVRKKVVKKTVAKKIAKRKPAKRKPAAKKVPKKKTVKKTVAKRKPAIRKKTKTSARKVVKKKAAVKTAKKPAGKKAGIKIKVKKGKPTTAENIYGAEFTAKPVKPFLEIKPLKKELQPTESKAPEQKEPLVDFELEEIDFADQPVDNKVLKPENLEQTSKVFVAETTEESALHDEPEPEPDPEENSALNQKQKTYLMYGAVTVIMVFIVGFWFIGIRNSLSQNFSDGEMFDTGELGQVFDQVDQIKNEFLPEEDNDFTQELEKEIEAETKKIINEKKVKDEIISEVEKQIEELQAEEAVDQNEEEIQSRGIKRRGLE